MARILSSLTLALLLISTATVASAHPRLTTSDPPIGGAVTASPTAIRLSFNEGLVPKFSGLNLTDARGKIVPTGPAKIDSEDRKKLIVPVRARLAPGRYQVNWHAVSEDTHRVTGRYSFQISDRGKAERSS